MAGLTPKITARNQSTGERFSTTAAPQGSAGHYSATLILPSSGDWEWSIEAFTMNQPMPPIAVGGVPQADGSRAPGMLPWLVGAAGMSAVIGGMVFLLRRGVRWAAAVVALGALAVFYGFASAAGLGLSSENSNTISEHQGVSPGQELFVAKGCTTCHSHAGIEKKLLGAFSVNIGPDLTRFTASPEYLRSWLSDPASVKPDTEMPDLNLSGAEIEELITFINSE
jgi:hypothetical protein